MWFVYCILCKDKSIYTGITTDVRKRFLKHRAGTASRYTRARKAVKILYSEKAGSQSKAFKREAEIKRWPKKKKLELVKRK